MKQTPPPHPKGTHTATQQDIKALYTRHVDTVYRVCYALLGNAHDTEDAVQDVFVKVIRSGKEFESAEHEKAWLIRVATNHCKDVLKRAARTEVPLESAPEPAAASEALDTTLQVVMKLPDKYRDVVYLYYYEGYTSAEIAQITGSPPSTVRNNLSEARQRLKRELGGDWI